MYIDARYIMRIMWRFFIFSKQQVKPGDFPRLFYPGSKRIDPCCFNACMPQNVSQVYDVFFHLIIGLREQVAQIVGKHFLTVYIGCLAQRLHHGPNIGAVQRFTAACNKNGTVGNSMALTVRFQAFAKRSGEENRACLSLVGDQSLSAIQCFCCNK